MDSGKFTHVFMNGMDSAPHAVTNMTSFKSRINVYTPKLQKNILPSMTCFTSSRLVMMLCLKFSVSCSELALLYVMSLFFWYRWIMCLL